jgi:hypothetical protein
VPARELVVLCGEWHQFGAAVMADVHPVVTRLTGLAGLQHWKAVCPWRQELLMHLPGGARATRLLR